MNTLKKMLVHPLMRGMDLDNPQTTQTRIEIIQQKKFLKAVYQEWYSIIKEEIPPTAKNIVEIGSGAGFIKETIPNLVKTEIFYLPGMDAILDAQYLPFQPNSLSAIVMTDVFHHLSHPRQFFKNSIRVLSETGKIIMIEPWVSRWSSWIYPNFHHEPFDPLVKQWEFPTSGPLSCSNQALPWIIFQRDQSLFTREFPQLKIKKIQPIMPFRYLLSGGVSLRSFMPGWSTGFWKWFESLFNKKMDAWAMFSVIVLEKISQ
jgi:SAM-dependent methyltransferase